MGGLGIAQSQANKNAGGAHIFAEGGSVVLDSCSVADDPSGQDLSMPNPSNIWLTSLGSMVLRNSTFRSSILADSSVAQPLLLNAAFSSSRVLFRGCRVENLGIQVSNQTERLGIVDSIFSPPLEPTIPIVQPPPLGPGCGVQLAGERLCDERAVCELMQSGVKCSCDGTGLRYKPGIPEDGRRCEQDAAMSAMLQSEVLVMTIMKPGSYSRQLKLILDAQGEEAFAVHCNITVARFGLQTGNSFAPILANTSTMTDSSAVLAFGQHIEWKDQPPRASWDADVDGSAFRYRDVKTYAFAVHLDCNGNRANCASDGDVLETVVRFASSEGQMQSQVTIQTNVQSLVSCDNTRSRVFVTVGGLLLEADWVVAESRLEVHLRAMDVYNFEVLYSKAEIELEWSSGSSTGLLNTTLNTQRGSNLYLGSIPMAFTKEPGSFTLVITARQGWSGTDRLVGRCELLRRTITVRTEQAQLIVALVLVGVLLVILALGLCLLYKNRERAKKFMISFVSYEGMLALDICLEAWGMQPFPV
jgi:hypothetical protein